MKIICLFIVSIFLFSCSNTENLDTQLSSTEIAIKNDSDRDSIKVFLTLQAPQSVVGHFGITKEHTTPNNLSQGYFWAKKDSVYTSSNNGKPFVGFVISFDTLNMPCEQAQKCGFKSGISIFEGTINVEYESFDISCVDGVNSIMHVAVDSTSGWQTGEGDYTKTFVSAMNSGTLADNYDIRGVFPYRCTNCINAPNEPKNCFDLPQKFNDKAICQTSRKGKQGGTINLTYKGNASNNK